MQSQHVKQDKNFTNHNNLDTSTLQNSTCYLPDHTSFHFLLSIPFCTTPWSQGSSYFLHGFHNIRRASEQTGAPLLVGLEISFFIFFISFGKQCLPSCLSLISAGLWLSRPFFASLATGTKPTMTSVVFLPQIFQSNRRQEFPEILCTRIVTHIPKPSVIVQNFEAPRNVSLFSARSCNR